MCREHVIIISCKKEAFFKSLYMLSLLCISFLNRRNKSNSKMCFYVQEIYELSEQCDLGLSITGVLSVFCHFYIFTNNKIYPTPSTAVQIYPKTKVDFQNKMGLCSTNIKSFPKQKSLL